MSESQNQGSLFFTNALGMLVAFRFGFSSLITNKGY